MKNPRARRAGPRYPPSMRILLGIFTGAVVAGCGLSLAVDPAGDAGPAPSAEPSTTAPAPSGTGTTPTPQPTGTAPIEADGATPDAAPLVDSGTDAPIVSADAGRDATAPGPVNVNVSYALGKDAKVYLFDHDAKTFTAGLSTNCPPGEETAVMQDGTVYVTSSDSRDLFRWSPATGCTFVGTANLPFALGTAFIGGVEQLVGYRDADYDLVSTTNATVTRLTNNALGALRPAGDYARVGTRAFLSVQTNEGACPAGGDCIVEIDPSNGRPLTAPKQYVGLGIFGLAQSRGKLLLYANAQVYEMAVATLTLGPSLKAFPTGALFSGAGAAALAP